MIWFATLALRYPAVFSFLKRFGKWIALAVAVAGLVWASVAWFNGKIDEADKAGFGRAQAQYAELVRKANARAAQDNNQLKLMQQRYAALSVQRQQQVKIVTQTKIERIEREVQAAPVYRQCSITDGVLNNLQDLAAAVNSSLGTD